MGAVPPPMSRPPLLVGGLGQGQSGARHKTKNAPLSPPPGRSTQQQVYSRSFLPQVECFPAHPPRLSLSPVPPSLSSPPPPSRLCILVGACRYVCPFCPVAGEGGGGAPAHARQVGTCGRLWSVIAWRVGEDEGGTAGRMHVSCRGAGRHCRLAVPSRGAVLIGWRPRPCRQLAARRSAAPHLLGFLSTAAAAARACGVWEAGWHPSALCAAAPVEGVWVPLLQRDRGGVGGGGGVFLRPRQLGAARRCLRGVERQTGDATRQPRREPW